MMNSSLASPIPSLGIMEKAKASSGFPRFIIISVFGRLRSFKLRVSLWKGRIPSYTIPSSPSAQLTVISLPVSSTSVALPAPTTAGIPKFPAYNSSMTSPASFVCDNCSCSFHDRLPIWSRCVRNQDFSWFKRGQIRNIRNHTSLSGSNFVSYTLTFSRIPDLFSST